MNTRTYSILYYIPSLATEHSNMGWFTTAAACLCASLSIVLVLVMVLLLAIVIALVLVLVAPRSGATGRRSPADRAARS